MNAQILSRPVSPLASGAGLLSGDVGSFRVGGLHQRHGVIAVRRVFVPLSAVRNGFPIGRDESPAEFPTRVLVLDEFHG